MENRFLTDLTRTHTRTCCSLPIGVVGQFGFIRSVKIWTDLFKIHRDLVKIWPNLIEIHQDFFDIWSYLAKASRFRQNLVDFCKILRRFAQSETNQDPTENRRHSTTQIASFHRLTASPSIEDPKWSGRFRVRHKPYPDQPMDRPIGTHLSTRGREHTPRVCNIKFSTHTMHNKS